MVASPPDMSLLALGVQFYATARIVEHIPAGVFYPKPKVDSAGGAAGAFDRRRSCRG